MLQTISTTPPSDHHDTTLFYLREKFPQKNESVGETSANSKATVWKLSFQKRSKFPPTPPKFNSEFTPESHGGWKKSRLPIWFR